MSLTLAERERMKLEITRLARQGWAEDKLRRVEAIRNSNPTWSFDRAWSEAERQQQNPAPEPTNISEATKIVQAEHPGWSFEQSWSYAETTYPKLVRGSTKTREARDPRLAPEITRHAKSEKGASCDMAAAVRLVQAANPEMTFEEAWDRVEAERGGR
jgi:hypothetical protein